MTKNAKLKFNSPKPREKKQQPVEKVDMAELVARAKELNERVAKNETTARELGELLLVVRDRHHYSLKSWIANYLGRDESTLNRCKYALSLADPASARNEKKRNEKQNGPWSKVIIAAVMQIRKATSQFEKLVTAGDVAEVEELRESVIKALDKLVARANYMSIKKFRKMHLDAMAKSDNPKTKAAGEKALAAEFNERTLLKEDDREVLEEKAKAQTAGK